MKRNQSGFTIVHGLAVILVVAVSAGVGFYVYNKNNKADVVADIPVVYKVASNIPTDWQDFKTELGFSMKIPAGWTGGGTSNTSFNGEIGKTITFNMPSDSSTDEDRFYGVSVGTLSFKGKTSEAALEEYLAKLRQESIKTYKFLGSSESEAQASVDVSFSTLQIGDRSWRQVESNTNGITTKSLLLWDKTHAIRLLVMSEDKAKAEKSQTDYLVPMAASVTVD